MCKSGGARVSQTEETLLSLVQVPRASAPGVRIFLHDSTWVKLAEEHILHQPNLQHVHLTQSQPIQLSKPEVWVVLASAAGASEVPSYSARYLHFDYYVSYLDSEQCARRRSTHAGPCSFYPTDVHLNRGHKAVWNIRMAGGNLQVSHPQCPADQNVGSRPPISAIDLTFPNTGTLGKDSDHTDWML